MNRLRRMLKCQFSVADVVEAGLWLAIPYLLIGIGWALLHYDVVVQLQSLWDGLLPAGGDVAGFGVAAAAWPALLLLPTACPVPWL